LSKSIEAKLSGIKSRRYFLNSLLVITWIVLIAPLVTLLNRFRGRAMRKQARQELEIPQENGAHLFDSGFILVKSDESIRLFSRACTHLGCQLELDQTQGLRCPCHGSKFNQQGEVLKGPAMRSLTEYRFSYLADNSHRLVVGREI
jgi:cytochrome b6-f complex iron-sulfur subunit